MNKILIRAGRLFDGESDHCRPQAFVVTEGDRIAEIGDVRELGSDLKARYAKIVDLGDDVTLLPGLINMHTHMSFSGGDSVFHDAVNDSDPVRMIRITENLRTTLASGVTTIRDCGTLPHLALPVRDAVEQGLLGGPRIVTSGAITSTGGHCWYCATEADDEVAVRQAVRAHVKDGVDFIKLFASGGNLTPGTNSIEAQFSESELCTATAEARRLGRRTASHAHGTDSVANSIKARVTTIEHCSFLTENGIGWEESLAREIADLGIYVCHTIFKGICKFESDPNYHFNEAELRQLEASKARLTLTRRLADAGVPLLAGNDAGVTHVGFDDFPSDLAMVAEGCGLSASNVLHSATSVAADALGREDIGRVRVGSAADLLAVAGDPTENISALQQTNWIMARGAIVDS